MEKDVSDEALMLRYRDGDYDAFEVLYQRHRQSLFRFMLRLCPNKGITEELFQDVWIKLIDARSRYEAEAKFTTYLFQIARNRVIDHFRKHSTFSEFNQSNFNDLMNDVPDLGGEQPDKQLEADESVSALYKLVNELPKEQKEVFLLREETGMTIPEIAQVIGENPEAVKSRLRYAIVKLKDGLKKSDE